MADTTKIQLRFGTMSGEKTWTFNNAKAAPDESDVRNLMDTMITNGSVYQYPPMTKVSAKVIVTSETNIAVEA